MKLRAAFNKAEIFELTWYPESNSSAQVKITKAQAKRDHKPCYEEYLLDEGDPVGVGYETLWYGSQGEIIASYDPLNKCLTIGA